MECEYGAAAFPIGNGCNARLTSETSEAHYFAVIAFTSVIFHYHNLLTILCSPVDKGIIFTFH